MALASAVQGATHTPQVITWTDTDTTPLNLTGATLTGKLRDSAGATRSITGTLVKTDAVNGVFTWTYSSADVATAGVYDAQFTATFADTTIERTLVTSWTVSEAL